MRRLLQPLVRAYGAGVRHYGTWMDRWETDLCSRATDRVVRPFEWGVEHCRNWPISHSVTLNGQGPAAYIAELNRLALADSDAFFGYTTPRDFTLDNASWLRFTSPVHTASPENNRVHALLFPARKPTRKAAVVLPHWNSTLPQQNALCAGLQRLGISTLRLSLPYHDARMPAELHRADFAVSSNIGRTIDATRQAVIDTRCCFDWLEQQGYRDFALIGTSLGSCYAFLASAHDPRIRVNVFNHCSTWFADVVWEGLSTRHVRESLEGAVNLDTLRNLWACISPPSYLARYTALNKRSKFIYTRYDTTFPLRFSRDVIAGAREHGWDHDAVELPCGHYTMGEFPFKFITGYHICSFVKRNL